MTSEQVHIGLMIKQLRLERGLTQKELARKASVHWTSISGYERGRERPNYKTLTRLAGALDVQLVDLIPSEGKRLPPPIPTFAGDRLSSLSGAGGAEAELLQLVGDIIKDQELYLKHPDLIISLGRAVKVAGRKARDREKAERRQARAEAKRGGMKAAG